MKTALQQLIEWGDKMMSEHPQKLLSFAEAIDKAEELLELERHQHGQTWDAAIHAHDARGHVYARSMCDFDGSVRVMWGKSEADVMMCYVDVMICYDLTN